MDLPLDRRPIIIALAGPNGAGKSTFFHAHLQAAGLRFVNADTIARELNLDAHAATRVAGAIPREPVNPYVAARIADAIRRELVRQRVSFVFETVFSDPVGDKLTFLKEAANSGYNVVLCFIGISDPTVCDERVAMRVSQDGHDVPAEKLIARFPRVIANLKRAIRELSNVWVFDNDDLRTPFRLVAIFQDGEPVEMRKPLPKWFRSVWDTTK